MTYSAGIIPFRFREDGKIEFFLGHPGGQGADWKNYWAYLKGGVEGNETWVETAIREFREESGLPLDDVTEDKLIPLGTSRQNKRKIVVAFGLHYPDIDPSKCFSNMADGCDYPEIDRYGWFTYDEVVKYTHIMHIPFYDQLVETYGG